MRNDARKDEKSFFFKIIQAIYFFKKVENCVHVRNTFTAEKSGVWVELFEAALLGVLRGAVGCTVQSVDVLRPTPAVRVHIQQGQHCQEPLW